MLRQAEVHNNLYPLEHKRLAPVLLQTGLHDDAVRYFAPAVALNNCGEFMVYVSETSLLCDLVKLKRSLLVEVIFAHSSFGAELSLAQVPAPSAQCALSLTLLDKREASLNNENWCPLT